jgi:lambda family phage portal protein
VLDALRKRLAGVIAPEDRASAAAAWFDASAFEGGRASSPRASSGPSSPGAVRMYQASRASRLTSGWATSTTSADSELVSSLQTLRNRSRALMRDAPHAKRAKVIVQNNVVGSGIGLQAQVMTTRGDLREAVNDALEEAFCEWSCAERCHTGGTLHFADLERALMGQVFEAGEVFVRKHARAFGDSAVPFALELIEPERLLEEFMQPVPQAPLADGAVVKMGIEVDRFGRPLAYWIRNRHPGDLQFLHGETNKIERVPADQIMHLRLVDRWPQTRGEPWLHAVARKLNDMDGYTEAEIVAARAAASYVFTIETPEPNTPLANEITATAGAATSREIAVEAGMGLRLAPGEKWETHSPNRPNPALDAFMRYMLREVAAGAGVSYESLSRDYSQSNYSSSRLALLDDRDLWKMLQQWFIRNFREPLHREWLRAAVLAGAIPGISVTEYALDQAKFEAARFKPRGWSWVDPTKEVQAAKEALKAGFTTRADIIAATADGRDIEDIDQQRVRELDDEKALGLEYDTSPTVYIAAETGSQKGTGAPPTPDGEGDIVGDTPAAAPADNNKNKSTKSGPPLRAVPLSER